MRWGICGDTAIAEDFCRALRCLNPSQHEIIAVFGQTLNSATEFSKKLNIENVYGDVEALANNSDIDIVYISSPPNDRYDHSFLMLRFNKHVLCEAPVCMTADDASSLIGYASAKELFLMESIWMCFLPVYKLIKEEIDRGTIGQVKHIDAAIFSDVLHKETRSIIGKSGGSLFNNGIYLMWLAYFIFQETAESMLTIGDFSDMGVDEACNIILMYKNGARASLSCHMQLKGRTDAWIYGTNGSIYIHSPFWFPNKITINDVETEFSFAEDKEFHYRHSIGFTYAAESVHNWIGAGCTESPCYTLYQILECSKMLEEVSIKLYKSKDLECEEHESFFERIRCTIL